MKYSYDRTADSPGNRVKNTKSWLVSADREAKRAEQVIAGVLQQYEMLSKHDKRAGDTAADLRELLSDIKKARETLVAVSKDVEMIARTMR